MLEQTLTDLEVIIVDDGSTDGTDLLVASFNDTRTRYLRLEHTGHIGEVRNAGAKIATGKWIAFLDSDDSWLPQKLGLQIQALTASGKKWSYCGFCHVDEFGKTMPAKAGQFRPVDGWITRKLLTHEVAAIVCSLMVDRSIFNYAGCFSCDPRLALRGDYEFVLRLSQIAEAVAVRATLVRVLEHKGRITHSIEDPFARSMVPYLVFLETQRDPGMRNIARQQINRLIKEQHRSKNARRTPLFRAFEHFRNFAFSSTRLP